MRIIATSALVFALIVAACGDGAPVAVSEAPGDSPTTQTPQSSTSTAGGDTSPPTTPPPASEPAPTTSDPVAREYGNPIIEGTPLPAMGPDPDPAVGLPAPVVVGSGHDDAEVRFGGSGAPHAVLFVAHWCPHCQDEVPEVVAWLGASGGVEGVAMTLVTVGVDPNRPNFPPSEWLDREDWPGPVVRDDVDSSTFRAYGGASIPYWVFLDGDGNVAARVAGRVGIDTLEGILMSLTG